MLVLVRLMLLSLLLGLPLATPAQGLAVRDLAVLVDADGSETIDSVSSAAANARFKPLNGILAAGYTRKVHWLRFTLQTAQPGAWWLEVQPPFLDDLRLFEPGASGIKERRAGDRLPFSSREEDYRGFVFKLALADVAERVYYLRLQTSSASLVSLKLWSPQAFDSARLKEYAALSFYYGFSTLAVLISLILAIWLREALYGWFGLVLLVHMSLRFASQGLAAQYLLPEAPEIADVWVGLASCLFMASTAQFFRRMLRVERDRHVYFNVFRVQLLLACALIPCVFSEYFPMAMSIAVSYMLFTALAVALECIQQWRQGRPESRYLLLGSLLFAAGGVRLSLLVLGWNTARDLSDLYFDQITSMLATLAVYIALAMRLRQESTAHRRSDKRADAAEIKAFQEQQAYAEQGRFIAMLSHELKTPLAVIDSAAQALERINESENPEIARRHERIRRSVSRIDRLIEQFLSKDQFEAQRMELHLAPVLLSTLLQDVFASCTDDPGRLQLDYQVSSASVVVDAALLRVAIINLIDNALKYSPPDSTVRVAVKQHAEGGCAGIEFLVADEGPGVPEQLRSTIFSRYTRGDNAARIAGAGLGLYLVRRIAELHGGRVELLAPGSGAAFRLWIPEGSKELP